jgi:hypothetical protein
MKIEFENPNVKLQNELRSKKLKVGSELYNTILHFRDILDNFAPIKADPKKRREPHIEIISESEIPTEQLLIQRAILIEGKEIDLSKIDWFHSAIVIYINGCPKYDILHITIEFFGIILHRQIRTKNLEQTYIDLLKH